MSSLSSQPLPRRLNVTDGGQMRLGGHGRDLPTRDPIQVSIDDDSQQLAVQLHSGVCDAVHGGSGPAQRGPGREGLFRVDGLLRLCRSFCMVVYLRDKRLVSRAGQSVVPRCEICVAVAGTEQGHANQSKGRGYK